jgi:hypothetical protein
LLLKAVVTQSWAGHGMMARRKVMLRHKQHSKKEMPAEMPVLNWAVPVDDATAGSADIRVPVLVELMDSLDLTEFFHDSTTRTCLREVLEAFTDEEFDRFERLYQRRLTSNRGFTIN